MIGQLHFFAVFGVRALQKRLLMQDKVWEKEDKLVGVSKRNPGNRLIERLFF